MIRLAVMKFWERALGTREERDADLRNEDSLVRRYVRSGESVGIVCSTTVHEEICRIYLREDSVDVMLRLLFLFIDRRGGISTDLVSGRSGRI